MSRVIDETIQNTITQGDYFLIDNTSTGTHRVDAQGLMDTKPTKIDGVSGTIITRYGVCSTEASTAAKAVTITDGTFTLETGARVTVKFSNTNTANSPTLSVNSGTAKNIYYNGNQITTGDNKAMLKGVVEFVYDGTQWQLIGDNNVPASTTPNMDGTASVGTSIQFARQDHVHPSDTSRIPFSEKGSANGVAELDENGHVPSSQLPSYIDDVKEYSSRSLFPATGESDKIYIDTSTNLTYRWGGSDYVVIASSLALGETSATAYRGDRGKTAYNHATESGRLTTAQTSGLYKFSTTAEGHIAGVTAVAKSDITGLGIPGQDTTYESKSAASGGTAVSLVTTGEKYNWNVSSNIVNTTVEDGDYVISQVSGTKTLAPYANSTYIMMPDIATTDSVDETLYGLLEDMEWEDYVVQDSIIPVTVNQTIGAIVQEGLAEKINTETTRADLDTTAATGTTDGDLYAAITALSWQSDVMD